MPANDSDDEIVCLTVSNRGQTKSSGKDGPTFSYGSDKQPNSRCDKSFGLADWNDEFGLPSKPKMGRNDTSWDDMVPSNAPKLRRTALSDYTPVLPTVPLLPIGTTQTSSCYYERLYQPTIVPNPLYSRPSQAQVMPAAKRDFQQKERPKSPSMLRGLILNYQMEESLQSKPHGTPIISVGKKQHDSIPAPGKLSMDRQTKHVNEERAQTLLVELSDSDTDLEIIDNDDERVRRNKNSNVNRHDPNEDESNCHFIRVHTACGNSNIMPRGTQVEAPPVETQHVEIMLKNPRIQCNTILNEQFSPAVSGNEQAVLRNSEVSHEEPLNPQLLMMAAKENDHNRTRSTNKDDPRVNFTPEVEVVENLTVQSSRNTQLNDASEVEEYEISPDDFINAVSKAKADKRNRIVTLGFRHSKKFNNVPKAKPMVSSEFRKNQSGTEIYCEQNKLQGTAEPGTALKSLTPVFLDTVEVRGKNCKKLTSGDSTSIAMVIEENEVIAEIEKVPGTPPDSLFQPSNKTTKVNASNSSVFTEDNELMSIGVDQNKFSSEGKSLSKHLPPLKNFSVGINPAVYEPSVPVWYTAGTFKRIREVLSKRRVPNS